MRRYLIVANQTLGGDHLLARIRSCTDAGPCEFHLVVPATPVADHLTWTRGESRALAKRRLDAALAQLEELGARATGEVGDASPVQAVRDAMRRQRFDVILLSTLAPGVSRWLRQDLPRRMRRAFAVPVEHVTTGVLLVA